MPKLEQYKICIGRPDLSRRNDDAVHQSSASNASDNLKSAGGIR